MKLEEKKFFKYFNYFCSLNFTSFLKNSNSSSSLRGKIWEYIVYYSEGALCPFFVRGVGVEWNV